MNEGPYRESPTGAERDPYIAAWEDLRTRRKRILIALLLVFPCIGIGLCADQAFQRFLPIEFGVVLLLPLIVVIWTLWLHLALFTCPRCGKRRQASLCPRCGILVGTSKVQADEAERVEKEADKARARARPPARRPHL
jgi:hypothetical protein